jgi:ribonuclease P protein component
VDRGSSLRRRADFERVRTEGRALRAAGVIVLARGRCDRDAPSRLGLAVGRSVGDAVERNRIRRRLRAAWRAAAVEGGVDVVVRPMPGAEAVDFQELVQVLRRAAQRVRRVP